MSLVESIQGDLKPAWGSMTLDEMLKHLTSGLELSASYHKAKIVVPDDKLLAFRKFLMTDKLFMKGAPIPAEYKSFSQPNGTELDQLKNIFLDKFSAFKKETEQNSDFWSIHPSFGKMDSEYTRQLQWKHITHHFTQFGIIK